MECRQIDKAIAEHEIASHLNPSGSFTHWAFGYALLRALRLAEAVERFDLALRLSPKDPASWTYLTLKASALYQLKRYDEAAMIARDATRFAVADLVWPYVHWAAALGQLNRHKEARSVVDELQRRRPGLTIAAFRSWPHNQSALANALDHTSQGLRKAGLPERAPPGAPS